MRYLLPLVGLLFSATLCRAQEVRPYDGKYDSDPHSGAFLHGLPAKMRASARAMSGRLGLPPSDAGNMVLELVDRPLGAKKEVQLGGTVTKVVNGRSEQWITLNPESHFATGGDFDVELDHEMTHALLRNALGDAQHRLLPKWAREGLAVWAAGQGPGRISFWLTIHWDKPDPVKALLNGLDAEKHSLEDYPEDFLAIAALESLHGVAGVQAFVKDLAAGTECRDAVAAASGKSWEEFEIFARAFAEARMNEALGSSEWEVWKRTMSIYRSGKDWPAAQRALYAITVKYPDSWAGALATYYFGRALQQAGRPDDARKALTEFIVIAGPRTGLMDDAVWNIGLCCEKSGDAEGAIQAYDRLAKEYSYSPQAAAGLLKAATLCAEAGRDDEAKARWERIVKDLEGTKEAAEARKHLGLQ